MAFAIPQVPRTPQAVERPHSYAAEQMARACGIPVEAAEDWLGFSARRDRGVRE